MMELSSSSREVVWGKILRPETDLVEIITDTPLYVAAHVHYTRESNRPTYVAYGNQYSRTQGYAYVMKKILV
jgi:hypothetical protein